MLAVYNLLCKIACMNSKHTKTLKAIFARPTSGNIEWSRIESLLVGVGCNVIEGSGSSVTFEKNGMKAYFHRPHPSKEALRYRVIAVAEFLEAIGIKP